MNVEARTIEDRQIDRLVDGELSAEEYRALLLQLDSEPGGWKRCALAFLEEQAWRETMGDLASESGAPAAPEAARPDTARRRRSRWLAPLAAGLLAGAFGLGWMSGKGSDQSQLEVAREDRGHGMTRVDRVEPPAQPPPRRGLAPIDSGRAASDAPVKAVAMLSFGGKAAGSVAPTYRVPLMEGPGLDERWLQDQPPALPEDVRRQWEREGYQVEQRRRLVSMDLDNGQRMAIPVDEVDVRFVGPNLQ